MTGKSSSKRNAENLRIIIKYCDDIEYLINTHGSDEEDFYDNISLQYSCAFSIIQIGEHIKRLSDELKKAHPEIDWRGVSGMRDIAAHNYPSVQIPRIRATILNEVPFIKESCLRILKDLNDRTE